MKSIKATSRARRDADPGTFMPPASVQALLGRDDGAPARIYRVAFGPESRMSWHRHDGIQILYGLSGTCTVVSRAGEEVLLGAGDVVVVEAGEEHWHGAAPGMGGEHLAINFGDETTWLERSG